MKIYNSSSDQATSSATKKTIRHVAKKTSGNNATTQGLAAIFTAMKNVAKDECRRSIVAISSQVIGHLLSIVGINIIFVVAILVGSC